LSRNCHLNPFPTF